MTKDLQGRSLTEATPEAAGHYRHDLVALQVGHLIDFYRANARDMRDPIARALPRWSSDIPGYSILLASHVRSRGDRRLCPRGG